MKFKRYQSKSNFKLAFIVLFLSIVVSLIPWDKINPKGHFIDRVSYFFSYNFKSYRLDDFEATKYYDYITNEWFWRYINSYFRNNLDVSPEIFFGIITFLAFLTYSYFILDKTKKSVALIYLLNIEYISFIYSQLRLAFAMSIFIMAIYLFRRKSFIFSLIFFSMCFLIHTSMVVFLGILLASVFISKMNRSNLIKASLIFLTGFMVNLLIGPFMEQILSSVGDRRAEYGDFSPPFYWYLIYIFYAFIAFYLIIKNKLKSFNDYVYVYAFIIFSLLITSYLLGGYVSRFIAASILFIIPSLFIIKGKIGVLFHCTYIIYLVFLWIGFLL